MPRGVYERKKTTITPPPRDTNAAPAEASKLKIGMLALRGYLVAIMLSGGVPHGPNNRRGVGGRIAQRRKGWQNR